MRDKAMATDSIAIAMHKPAAFDQAGVRGELHILIKDQGGRVKIDERRPNLVVTVGRAHIADQLAETEEAQMSHMAIGTGSTAPDASDTALETELTRVTVTPAQGTGGNANQVIYVGDYPPGTGTGAITEAGIFNQASAGTLLCRSTFPVKNKEAGDSMTITWTLTFSS